MKNIAAINTMISNSYDQNIITVLNELSKGFDDVNMNVFTTAFNLVIPNKKFTILPIYEAKYFFGTGLVWDIISLDLALGFPNLEKIIYIHDNSIPWRREPNSSYSRWENLFSNSRVKTIISHANIAEIFQLVWSNGIYVQEIDYKYIYENI